MRMGGLNSVLISLILMLLPRVQHGLCSRQCTKEHYRALTVYRIEKCPFRVGVVQNTRLNWE